MFKAFRSKLLFSGVLGTSVLTACAPILTGSNFSAVTAGMGSFVGRVLLGPVNGATVTVYEVNSNGTRGSILGTATTNATGDYTLTARARTGAVLVVATGGTYVEEGSGLTVALGSNEITAIAPALDTRTVSLTPISHMAAGRALALAASGTDASLAANLANAQMATAAGLTSTTDVTALIPPIPTATLASQGVSSTSDQAKLGTVTAAISRMATASGTTSADVADALKKDFAADGKVDGLGTAGAPIATASGNLTLTSQTWTTDLPAQGTQLVQDTLSAKGFTTSSVPATAISSAADRTKLTVTTVATSNPSYVSFLLTTAAGYSGTLHFASTDPEAILYYTSYPGGVPTSLISSLNSAAIPVVASTTYAIEIALAGSGAQSVTAYDSVNSTISVTKNYFQAVSSATKWKVRNSTSGGITTTNVNMCSQTSVFEADSANLQTRPSQYAEVNLAIAAGSTTTGVLYRTAADCAAGTNGAQSLNQVALDTSSGVGTFYVKSPAAGNLNFQIVSSAHSLELPSTTSTDALAMTDGGIVGGLGDSEMP